MGILGIIAGLILLLAGSGWFAGAVTVGWILLIGGAVLLAVQVIFAAVAFRKVNNQRAAFRSRF